MPVVPLRRQVQTAPIPGVRRQQVPIGQVDTPQIRNNPSPNAAQFGEQLARSSQQFLGVALEQREREKARQDRVATLEADRKIATWENVYLRDPEKGALLRKGKNAFGLPDEALEQFDKQYDDISAGLSTDQQRQAFYELAATRRRDLQTTVFRHTAQELQAFEKGETDSYIRNAQEAAIGNATDPARVRTEIERQQLAISQFADDNGLGAEAEKLWRQKAISDTHLGVVDALLAQGLDQQAQLYAKQYREEIAGSDRARLDKALNTGSKLGDAIRGSDRIRSAFPFGTEGVNQQTWMDEAAKIADPEVRQEVEQRLRIQWNQLKADAADQQQAKIAEARAVVDNWVRDAENRLDAGMAEDQLRRLPGWSDLPDNTRKDLLSYARMTAKGTEDIQTDQEVWGRLWRLGSNLASQQDFAKLELWRPEYRGKLSNSDYQELVKLQGAILRQKPEETDKLLDDWRTATQVINQTLKPLGILEDSEQYKAVTRQLAIRQKEIQQRSGKPATNDELQKALDGLLIELVTSDGWLWDTKKRAFQVEEGDIPAALVPQIDQLLKQGGFPVTPENRTRLYIEKLKAEQGKK